MIHAHSPQIIFDYIWHPLVHIPDGQRAFLVHPGTTQKPQELASGWHWHWPLLTSIRRCSPEQIQFQFNDHKKTGNLYTDEPITAVSHDHHLFSTQGIVTLNINAAAPAETLAQLNRHTIKRVIRPIIRQSLRQALAQFEAKQATKQVLSDTFLQIANPLFSPHGIVVHHIDISSLNDYQPFATQKPRP